MHTCELAGAASDRPGSHADGLTELVTCRASCGALCVLLLAAVLDGAVPALPHGSTTDSVLRL